MDNNQLYPIFLKAEKINMLIIGGGKVGYEKLSFLLKSSPNAQVEVLSEEFTDTILELCKLHNVYTIKSRYTKECLNNKHIVIAATNDRAINMQIYHDAKQQSLLTNVADTPDLCDFYLGGVVTKGQIKIAISTNGKSPTLAKRLRQFLEEVLPNDTSKLAENLNTIRNGLKESFEQKVETLNNITKNLINNDNSKT